MAKITSREGHSASREPVSTSPEGRFERSETHETPEMALAESLSLMEEAFTQNNFSAVAREASIFPLWTQDHDLQKSWLMSYQQLAERAEIDDRLTGYVEAFVDPMVRLLVLKGGFKPELKEMIEEVLLENARRAQTCLREAKEWGLQEHRAYLELMYLGSRLEGGGRPSRGSIFLRTIGRSLRIERRIEQVRRLPAKTEGQRAEKREQAKLLRMEVLLENAQLIADTLAALEENPHLTAHELRQHIKDHCRITHPELTEGFIQKLVTTRDTILHNQKTLEVVAGARGVSLAEVIFAGLLPEEKWRSGDPSDLKPRGEVNLETGFPLAIVLEVTEDDFKRIDPEENLGGVLQCAEETFS